jgi:hypothetical protein
MIRSLSYAIVILFAVLLVFADNNAASARESAPGDLFYNYYVPPVGYESVGAQLYPCPRPVPPLVGWTYITYQPLMPQEFMYHHHRQYMYYHADGGRTVTSVSWNCRPMWYFNGGPH